MWGWPGMAGGWLGGWRGLTACTAGPLLTHTPAHPLQPPGAGRHLPGQDQPVPGKRQRWLHAGRRPQHHPGRPGRTGECAGWGYWAAGGWVGEHWAAESPECGGTSSISSGAQRPLPARSPATPCPALPPLQLGKLVTMPVEARDAISAIFNAGQIGSPVLLKGLNVFAGAEGWGACRARDAWHRRAVVSCLPACRPAPLAPTLTACCPPCHPPAPTPPCSG